MPFNGAGIFNVKTPEYPAVPGTLIEAAKRNAIDADFATGLTNCMPRDGQAGATAHQNFAGFNLLNGGVGNFSSLSALSGTSTLHSLVVNNALTATGTSTFGSVTSNAGIATAVGSLAEMGRYIDMRHENDGALDYSIRFECSDAPGTGQGQLVLGATGGLACNGNITTTGSNVTAGTEVRAGSGAAGEKRMALQNAARNAYFYLNDGATIGLWDASGGFGRWTSDPSGNFTVNANITAFSDERVKYSWKKLPLDFIAKLAKVRSGTYNRKDVPLRQVGVSAQSLQEILPEAVLEDQDGMLSVAYGNAALAACIELAKEVTLLRRRVSMLEAK